MKNPNIIFKKGSVVMKNILKILSCAMVLPFIASCGQGTNSEASSSSNQQESSSQTTSSESSELSVSSSSSQGTSQSSTSKSSSASSSLSSSSQASSSSSSSSADSSRPTYTPPAADSPIAAAYGYTPRIPTQMARIDINTTAGTNNWATDINRNYKLSNAIEYETATVSVSDCDATQALTNVPTKVKVRGNYTLDYPQKGIRLKFDSKQKLLGLNNGAKNKSWVLLADYKDLANTNNALSLYLAQNMLKADGFYASDFTYANVYINNTYWGVYLVAEQQQSGSSRINITEPATDYEGTDIGYICELDYYYNEENLALGGDHTFTINYEGNSLTNYDGDTVSGFINGYTMKSDTYSDAQRTFIRDYVQNTYKLMYQAARNNTFLKFNDTHTALVPAAAGEFASAKECIAASVDLQSLVDMYILQDIACDPDVGYSSFYLDVDMSATGDKKLRFEAPWDYDSGYGITTRMADPESGTFAANHKGQNKQPYYPNAWFTVLIHQQWFRDMISLKWSEMKHFNLFQKSLDMVADIATKYETDFANLKAKWPQKFNRNSERTNQANSRTTQKEAAQDLLNWTKKRYEYLDHQYGDGSLSVTTQTLVANLPSGDIGGGGQGGGNTQITFNENDNDVTGNKYRFEAENAGHSGSVTMTKSGYNASGPNHGYIGDFRTDSVVSFNISAPSAADAYLYVGIAATTNDKIDSWWRITVNGTQVNVTADKYVRGQNDFHAWYSMPVGKCHLNAGTNVISLTALRNDFTNMDYIELQCPVALTAAA